jgi:hypothetical protein
LLYFRAESFVSQFAIQNIKIYGTIILFENRVLMNIFGPKRDEVTGEWRKLHN